MINKNLISHQYKEGKISPSTANHISQWQKYGEENGTTKRNIINYSKLQFSRKFYLVIWPSVANPWAAERAFCSTNSAEKI
jgi:hypothetical protein